MLTRPLRCAAALVMAFASITVRAADAAPTTPTPRIADLGWLAGHWLGTLANGATFEAHYTGPDGGTIVSASKEVRGGRTVAFELEVFSEENGRVVYQPFPHGQRSPHAFPLVSFDPGTKCAVFENKEHDFPQSFEFSQPTPDSLVITLRGPGRDGRTREIRYALRRVK